MDSPILVYLKYDTQINLYEPVKKDFIRRVTMIGERYYGIIKKVTPKKPSEKEVIVLLCPKCGNWHRIDDKFPDYDEPLLAN